MFRWTVPWKLGSGDVMLRETPLEGGSGGTEGQHSTTLSRDVGEIETSLQVPAPGTQVRLRKRREVRSFQSSPCCPVTLICESTCQVARSLWHNVIAHLQSCYYFQIFFPWGNYQKVIKHFVSF